LTVPPTTKGAIKKWIRRGKTLNREEIKMLARLRGLECTQSQLTTKLSLIMSRAKMGSIKEREQLHSSAEGVFLELNELRAQFEEI
jgi:hypothetical protein